MPLMMLIRTGFAVALLTEGVDRNVTEAFTATLAASRPPHGGRG